VSHSSENRRQRFIREYLVDLNGTQAAIRAGYSRKTANRTASRLLSKADISRAIAEGQKQRFEKLEITADAILAEIASLAFSDITDYVHDDGMIDWQLIKSLPRDKRVAVQKLIVDTTGGSGDGERKVVLRTRFECANKLQALELLGKHKKLFTEKVELTGDAELIERLLAGRQRLATATGKAGGAK
jgi:phage terminase small subunit